MSYIAYINDAEQGPYSFEDLEMCEQVGDISDATNIRLDGHDVWKPWAKIKQEREELVARKRAFEVTHRPASALVAPQVNLPSRNLAAPAIVSQQSTKSRAVFVILGLFFGCLGIHNFYAGYTSRGLIQLLITVLLGWLFVGVIITGLWALIEIIVVKEDSSGATFS